MRRLFVHIGTHKTGSTSFQGYLTENLAKLRAARVAVATERTWAFGEQANCFKLANSVLRPGLMTQARMSGLLKVPGFLQDTLAVASMRAFLSDRKAERFVLSAEALSFARESGEMKKLRRLFTRRDIEVVPVVVFRAEADWRRSWAAQIRRWDNRTGGAHGTGTGDIRGDWVFDRAAIRAFWSDLGRLRVVDYDSAMAEEGSIVPVLLREMGLPDDPAARSYVLNREAGSQG